MSSAPVVLITGAAKRVGANIARKLHGQGMCIAIHYRQSAEAAQQLYQLFNQQRPQSAILIKADLQDTVCFPDIIGQILTTWGRLDVLINNASTFLSAPLAQVTTTHWQALLDSNLKAPFFLTQTAVPHLIQQRGCIINMVDIQAITPLRHYSVYCIAKAGLVMATKALAKELGPQVRVNAIAPGVILWPDEPDNLGPSVRTKILARTALKRCGTPEDIANACLFLITQADYITGQIITIDGGRSLHY